MKRTMAVVAATALTLAAFAGTAGSAGAAGSPIDHARSNMAFADAGWYSESGDEFTASGVSAGKSLWGSGTEIHVWRTVGTMGGTTTSISADATSGFAFTIDAKRLSGASLSATNLPAVQCSYDESGEPLGECTDTTLDIAITWSGRGTVTKGSYNEHVRSGSSLMRVHVLWTSRDALASGSMGSALNPADLEYAGLSTEKQVKMGR